MDNGRSRRRASGLLIYSVEYLDTHIFVIFFRSIHEFAISKVKRGEPWLYRAANTSGKDKKGFITASAGASAGRFCMDLMP